MNKKEAELFDEFINNFLEETWDGEGNPQEKQIKWLNPLMLKNWITEHDKREKEKLLIKIKEEINSNYKLVIQDNIEEIINKHKNNE